jgi:hypothetical protein
MFVVVVVVPLFLSSVVLSMVQSRVQRLRQVTARGILSILIALIPAQAVRDENNILSLQQLIVGCRNTSIPTFCSDIIV